jgi:hypothetical protein
MEAGQGPNWGCSAKVGKKEITPLSIIKVVKLIKIGWTGHIKSMAKLRNAYKLAFGEPKRKRLFWIIILKRT